MDEGVHNYSPEDKWVKPEDPQLLERLSWFQDQKLGLMMHWGPYSQLGLVESWALSDDDASWSRGGVDWTDDGELFKRQYFDLNRTFNPIRFQPEAWAELAEDAGFKYLIFTTKHHDGFCMWDTHLTDYRITGPDCPFHYHARADICRHLFDAFRARGMAIATYFSKADWHCPDYWTPGMERGHTMWRGPSYDPKAYPWLWEKFVTFTENQILELMTRYGRIDILWLDAGWVCAANGQDIRIEEIVRKAREHQPWLIAADRTVGGTCENYVTPEQTIPPEPLLIPWESNITLGGSFSYCYDDTYKPLRQVVHMLVDVVAKGGNLALNVGPQPDGRLPARAIDRLRELGAWMKVHGEAIYETRPCAPYRIDTFALTRKADKVYIFNLFGHDAAQIPEQVILPDTGRKVLSVDLLGLADGLSFSQDGSGLTVQIPANARQNGAPPAHVFRLNTADA